jgi:osmotically-inducible protein OsmY
MEENKTMKKYLPLLLLMGLTQWGCSGAFWGGAATGALGSAAAYEYSSHRQMEQLEDDYKKERISRKEYESRKRQIESGSILY